MRCQVRYPGRGGLARAVALALAAASLAAPSMVSAEASPYQSNQRSAVGTGLGQTPLPSGLVFLPRGQVATQYVDNLNLAEDGKRQVNSFGLEVVPGIYTSYSSERATAALDYALVGRLWEDSDSNDLTQRLFANGQWDVVPEWFRLGAIAGYDDTIVDPDRGANYGRLGIFQSGALAERANAAVMPTLSHRFANFDATARYSYGRVWYFEDDDNAASLQQSGASDSEDQSARVSLRTARSRGARWNGELFYDWRQSDFDDYARFRNERAGAEVEYEISSRLNLLLDGGFESDLANDTTQGGLDESFWHVGLAYDAGGNTRAKFKYGQRFFGDSFSVDIRRLARQLEFTASYSEDPTVQTQRINMVDFVPGELPGQPPGLDIDSLGAQPFLGRNARAGIAALGSRTRIDFGLFWNERDFIDDGFGDDTNQGINLMARRDFASNLAGEFEASLRDYDRDASLLDPVEDPAVEYRDVEFAVRMIRSYTPRISATAETGYLTRSGDREYDGWWVALRLSYEPGL